MRTGLQRISLLTIFLFPGALLVTFCAAAQTAPTERQRGTTLEIVNDTTQTVQVLLTLGSPPKGNPYNQITDVRDLRGWNVVPEGTDFLKGKFILRSGIKHALRFNSGNRSLSGNFAFGPTFKAMGAGSNRRNACYPNATNLAEFTLNQPGETVDFSNVNGSNARIAMKLGGSAWDNGSWQGASSNVTRISDEQPINAPWLQPPGVYGWQATNCTTVVLPVPNGPPSNLAPAPRNAPNAPQLQTNPQCNIQRSGPGGGTVLIVFGGYHANSAPPPNCR